METDQTGLVGTAILLLVGLSAVHYAVVFYGTIAWKAIGGAIRLVERMR